MFTRPLRSKGRTSRLIFAFVLVALGFLWVPSKTVRADSQSCAGLSAAGLDHLFKGQVGRVVGSDYARPFVLPNGNTLVLMQDVFLPDAVESIGHQPEPGRFRSQRCRVARR